jgi:hypothetical protein
MMYMRRTLSHSHSSIELMIENFMRFRDGHKISIYYFSSHSTHVYLKNKRDSISFIFYVYSKSDGTVKTCFFLHPSKFSLITQFLNQQWRMIFMNENSLKYSLFTVNCRLSEGCYQCYDACVVFKRFSQK